MKYADAGSPGFVDCCKLICNNFHIPLKVQYHNTKEGEEVAIQMDAWFDRDLYGRHCFVGRCSTNSDNRMVYLSPLFPDILSGSYTFT